MKFEIVNENPGTEQTVKLRLGMCPDGFPTVFVSGGGKEVEVLSFLESGVLCRAEEDMDFLESLGFRMTDSGVETC